MRKSILPLILSAGLLSAMTNSIVPKEKPIDPGDMVRDIRDARRRLKPKDTFGEGFCWLKDCGKKFLRKTPDNFYCSKQCRDRAAAIRRAERDEKGIKPHRYGADR